MLSLQEAAEVEMPPAMIHQPSVLMGPVELVDSKLLYNDLDKQIDQHGIDITGLAWSDTKNCIVFRLYRLMSH